MSFHFKTIQATKDLLDSYGNVIIGKDEIGFCTSYAPPGELDSKERGLFAVIMENWSPENPRWYHFEPFSSFEWQNYFVEMPDTNITEAMRINFNNVIEQCKEASNGN